MEQALHLPAFSALQSDERTPPLDGELGVYSFSGSFGSPSRLNESVSHEGGQGEGTMDSSVPSPSHSLGRSTPDAHMLESAVLSSSQPPFLANSSNAGTAGEERGGAQQGPEQPSWTFPDQSAHTNMSIGEEFDHLSKAKARGEERLKAIMASKEHARRNFPRIRRVWKDLYLKLMVAGETGHGKTTFINNMFLSYTSGKEVKPHDGTRTSVDEFLNEPDKLCAKFLIENDETMERVHYSIQDTPGYGDDTDIDKSIRMIVDYVRKKNEDYFQMEKDYTRTESLSAQEDPRVDVCLYFIAAHRLKFIDIKFMQAISTTVAIIPIIAKADSMTAEETATFRRYVMDECEKHKISLFDFAAEAKAAVGIPSDLVVPPFAVVASNRFDEVRGSGSFWPVRDYLWGTCEAFSTQHSDCTYLKKLLLEEGFHELRRATEERYLEYRREVFKRQQSARIRRKRWIVALFAVVLCAVTVFLAMLYGPDSIRKANPLRRMTNVFKNSEVVHLSHKLKKKEHQLEMAEHKIDMLVKAVQKLEEKMSTLTAMGAASGFWNKEGGEGMAECGDEDHMAADAASKQAVGGDRSGRNATTGARPKATSAEPGSSGGKTKSGASFPQSSASSGGGSSSSSTFHHCHAQHGSESHSCRAFASRAGAASAAATKPVGPQWADGTQDQRFVDGRAKAKKWF